ncbi:MULTISPECIES: PQQ-dependent sugar dehydrogenase [Methanoculleus]|nr:MULTISPECIES: PQQ-dependent sugar dehydrogenase [Methanoculleus]UYU18478.1 PQQ-dependent sugar dehydrogenase [Methanoculleus submarinus]
MGLEPVAGEFTMPVALASPGDGTGRLFVADLPGTVRVIDGNDHRPFLDITDRVVDLRTGYDERGLLGLAFHPRFAENGRFFVYYSAPLRAGAPEGWDHTSRISEFSVSTPDRADPGSERVILEVDQPQANHNGGSIVFGPDGCLYIPLGDGGGARDVGRGHPPGGNGQDITTLLGSILRIDIDGAEPYGIPGDNPFVGREGRDEIYAYGLRNPWRMTFDAGGEHRLFAADAGQYLWESVKIIVAGGNHGWNLREGNHAFDPENPRESPADVPRTGRRGEPLIDAIIEYPNAKQPGGIGQVVIGGYVYRGRAIPRLFGRYVFAEWNRAGADGEGIIFAATPPKDPNRMWEFGEVEVAGSRTVGAYVLAFGEDAEHELYVLTAKSRGPAGKTGRVHRIVPPPDDRPGKDANPA